MIKIPNYLNEENCKILLSENNKTILNLIDWTNDLFEIYYFWELFDDSYITDIFQEDWYIIPCKIVAKSITNWKEFLLFDWAKYWYNALFVDKFDKEKIQERKLIKFEALNSKIKIELWYSIDYEEEKEDYELIDGNFIETINDDKISWNNLKQDWFDYISIKIVDENNNEIEICDLELA